MRACPTITKNSLFRYILVIFCAIILIGSLLGCAKENNDTELTATEQLDLLLFNLKGSQQKITGAVHYDDKLHQSFDGIIDKPATKLALKINDAHYYYASKVLLKSTDSGYFVENPDTNLASLADFTPFNLLNFLYSEQNSDTIFMTDSTINITFANKGARLSFGTSKAVLDGRLTIVFANNNITNSVFTAMEGNKKLTCYYQYSQSDNILNMPTVEPSSTWEYAKFIVDTLSKKYGEHTILTKSNNFDTEAKISSIDLSINKIDKVTSVDITNEQKYFTLTIKYSVKTMIMGINSAIETITIQYDNNYDVLNLRINSTDYILKTID